MERDRREAATASRNDGAHAAFYRAAGERASSAAAAAALVAAALALAGTAAAQSVAPAAETEAAPKTEAALQAGPSLAPQAEAAAEPATAASRIGCAEARAVWAAPETGEPALALLAIVVEGLAAAEAADPELASGLLALDAPLAFTVDPRRPGAQAQIDRIRAAGHEALLRLPISAEYGGAQHDRGPEAPTPALHTGLIVGDNLGRLRRALDAATGYAGVYAGPGAPITANAGVMKPLLLELKAEGCPFVDGRGSNRSVAALLARALEAPIVAVTDAIDVAAGPRALFAALERAAYATAPGEAGVVLAHARPATLAALRWWLEKRITTATRIAPISAAADLGAGGRVLP